MTSDPFEQNAPHQYNGPRHGFCTQTVDINGHIDQCERPANASVHRTTPASQSLLRTFWRRHRETQSAQMLTTRAPLLCRLGRHSFPGWTTPGGEVLPLAHCSRCRAEL